MNHREKACLLLSLLTAGSLYPGCAAAEETTTGAQDLGEVVITANRTRQPDVAVPAATKVITARDIEKSGAQNAGEALAKTDGITYAAFGPNGAAMGTMSNDVVIRGVGNGTLILLNGQPVSWRGKYDLSSIPAASIARIEVVKGSGSVLYGSEAMGGVVNIITKKGAANTATAGIGNSGQHHYAGSVGDDRLAITYDFLQWKHGVDVSKSDVTSRGKVTGSTKTNVSGIEKRAIGLTYQLNPQLSFLYQYLDTRDTYARWVTSPETYADQLYNARSYKKQRHIAQLNYDDGVYRGGLYFNSGTVVSVGPSNFSAVMKPTPDSFYQTREKNITCGLDLQRKWNLAAGTNLIAGMDWQRESFERLPAHNTTVKQAGSYSRNNWGIFAQLTHDFTPKDTGVLGMRETWTSGANDDQNYHNFSASGQWLHRMDKENNWYVNIAQSFIMPKFAQIYGASQQAVPAEHLKPQKGINYELGWKQNHGAHEWRLALFHMDIDDNIAASWNSAKSDYTYANEDFRNTGLELSDKISTSGSMSYHWGITWQNPEIRASSKGYWDRKYGRLQLTGGATCRSGKLTSTLDASYLGCRVQAPTQEHSYAIKPYLLTTWNTIYQPDDRQKITLTVNNLLDRHDIISHSTSRYYCAPASYMLNYTYQF